MSASNSVREPNTSGTRSFPQPTALDGDLCAARLGYAGLAITLRVYAHVIRTAEAAAADIFAEAVQAA